MTDLYRYIRLLAILFLLHAITSAVHANERSVLLAAVGDVMVSRTVPGTLAKQGTSWAWAGIAPLLGEADLRFCNLECAASEGGRAIPKRYSFRADPELTSEVLKAGKFNLISLANNHTYDYDRSGLARTVAVMQDRGFVAFGAGEGRAKAIKRRLVACNGLKIAFVAYTCWPPEGYSPADEGTCLATYDEGAFAAELREAKKGADLLVVSMHWGKEYATTPDPAQRRIAREAIDAGADLVLGHHPHVAQPVETYRDRPVFYSMGNCLFDRSNGHTGNGLLLLVRLARGKVTVERQVPLAIYDSRPVPVK